MSHAMPAVRPAVPHFSSGPCAKRPGWSLSALTDAVLGRSHRSKIGRAKLKRAIDLTREVLDCDLAAEMSARALYQEAATHCHAVKDYVSRDLFEKLMHDEEEHIDYLETQLDLVAKLGLELYAQHHMGKTDDDHSD